MAGERIKNAPRLEKAVLGLRLHRYQERGLERILYKKQARDAVEVLDDNPNQGGKPGAITNTNAAAQSMFSAP
jgi:hypothetical protein